MTTETQAPLICSLVDEERRMEILPHYAGQHFMSLEGEIFHAMQQLSADYHGGYWTMWELSNGGFYMAPGDRNTQFKVECASNWYSGTMSADAAGIVACLIGFNRLAWFAREDRFTDLFYALRDWALEHPESKEILAAID